jgi:hypothetical protein
MPCCPIHIGHVFVTYADACATDHWRINTVLNSRFAYLSAVALSAVFANAAQAQLFGGLKDRLVNAVEGRVVQKVEEQVVQVIEDKARDSVDQSFNAMFGGSATAAGTDGQGSPSILSGMLDTSNITTEDEYHFDLAATFEIQAIDSGGTASEPMQMVFHYAANAPYTGTRMLSGEGANTGAAMIIYDFSNQIMLMLMDAEESRFSIAYNWAIASAEWNKEWEMSPGQSAADMPQFESIGTRTINGYASEGYRTEDEKQTSEIWVSKEVAPGIERIFQANRTVPALNSSMPAGYPQGMIMEMNTVNKKNGEKVQMRTVSIDTDNEVSYNMSDYPLMSLGTQPAAQ